MRSVYNWGRSRLRRPEKPVRKELLAFDTVVQKAKDFLRCSALHDWQLQNSRKTDLTKFCHVRLKSTMKLYNDTIEWRFLFLLPAWFCDDLKLGNDVRKSVTQAVTDACRHPDDIGLESISDGGPLYTLVKIIVIKFSLYIKRDSFTENAFKFRENLV